MTGCGRGVHAGIQTETFWVNIILTVNQGKNEREFLLSVVAD